MTARWIERHHLPLFFLLCLAISWAVWIPMAVAKLSGRLTSLAGGNPANLLAVWGPALSAILVSWIVSGRAGPRDLFASIGQWRVGFRWLFFVLLYPAAVWALARGIDWLLGASFDFSIALLAHFPEEQAYMLPVAILFAFPNTLGEELGWRGFALPRLQVRHNALLSSLVVGLVWAVWHLPMWVANGMLGASLLPSAATITASAILFTWVYNNTSGSLLLAWMLHASMTITQYFLETPLTATDDVLRVAIPLLVVLVAGAAHLSRRHERQTPPAVSPAS